MTEDDPHGLYYCKATAEEIEDCKKFIVPSGITLTLTEEQCKIFAEPSSLKILTEWINIKDRLPEDGQRCLIYAPYSSSYDKDGKICIYTANFYKGEDKPNGPWSFYDNGAKYGCGNNQVPWAWKEGPMQWFGQDITHWMPLPEPPEVQ